MQSRTSFGLIVLALLLPAFAQAEQTVPAYDVVSIKVNTDRRNSKGVDIQGDTFRAGNLSVRELLARAYGINSDLILGVPSSLDPIRFDVEAKIIGSDPASIEKITSEQRTEMLRAAIVGRFALKAHIEVRTLPVFDLVVAHDGPKLQTTPVKETARNSSISMHGNSFKVSGLTMSKLAATLTDVLHRKVIDKTGLTDKYSFTLKWSPDDAEDDNAPSIFTAIQEQLGLRLVSSKGPVETLVIDHIEMPTEN